MSLSNFPIAIDTEFNLYEVHDGLRVKLAEDYSLGDTSITIYDENNVMSTFPDTGIITLTEQCSDVDLRALSFTYCSKTDTSFDGLIILDGFIDNAKPKTLTNVTLNVMAAHHNAIKDAIIAVEDFVGIKGIIDTVPFGPKIEGRLNFLRKMVFTPRAWFSVNNTIGLVPLTVTFTDESFRLGDGDVTFLWDFGDHSVSNISIISVLDTVPTNETNVIVYDLNGGSIAKTYTSPGKYDVTLTVTNEFGQDIVIFNELIIARIAAPDEAVIDIVPKSTQTITQAGSPSGGPYTTTPIIRSSTNNSVIIEIQSGRNPATGRSYAGEELVWEGGAWIARDPIEEFTWKFGDDLTHSNYQDAEALFSIGGNYDLILRVDTNLGAYRITKYTGAFDILESQNIWLWTFSGPNHDPGDYSVLSYLKLEGDINVNEFGLLSETFKSLGTTYTIQRSDSFLDGTANEDQAKQEFRRNVAVNPKSTVTSGNHGTAFLYYATQDNALPVTLCTYGDHIVNILAYNGFEDTYVQQDQITRPWNWIALSSPTKTYFLYGAPCTRDPFENPSYDIRTDYDLLTSVATDSTMTIADYQNGAEELMSFPSTYDGGGDPENGEFAVYKTAWKDSAGYILRNNGVGAYFRIASFYKTTGTVGEEFQYITKLTDMAGPIKQEGQLVALSDGLFFFNNTGNISAYNATSQVWETGGASAESLSFRSLQDTSIQGFDLVTNTLLATSNGDRSAYLSFDYSPNAFIKFNSLELTFSNVGPRPGWEDNTKPQFAMGMY
jgi:PKD repeat protein